MYDRILGCLIGGLIGDAAGATLEFQRNITLSDVQSAMQMPGGGVHNVGPGQVTDDSELMMALANALLYDKKQNPAKNYIKWYASMPFDAGTTCAHAFSNVKNAMQMQNNARKYNWPSESNGALMRCAPIACFGASKKLSITKIAQMAREDAMLSHPNPVCQECNAAFCVALAHLLTHPGDTQGALASAKNSIQNEKVAAWIEEDAMPISCEKNMGHVKYAFIMAFTLLRRGPSYEEALLEVLKRGGDTDTNACIVGYMIGALHGFHTIPDSLWEPVLRFDCTKKRSDQLGNIRPSDYINANVVKYARAFAQECME